MRRGDEAARPEQRARLGRLLDEGPLARARDMAALQPLFKRGLVDKAAARAN
jgi:hypothetical protein